MADIEIKRGEGKTINFEIILDGDPLDVSGDVFSFVVKEKFSDTTYTIEKTDGDFDKSQASSGIVSITLDTSDTDIDAKLYIAELESTFTAVTDVDKSPTWTFEVQESVH